jgi:hypothetical protein
MNTAANTQPLTRPATEAPAQRPAPAGDPLREAPEVVEEIAADCRVNPGKYLEEVVVPGGGE